MGGLLAGQAVRADDALSRGNDGIDIFIGDVGDSTIKQVNISTGVVQTFASTNFPNGLNGVMGLIFVDGELIASNQNFGTENGDILRFDGRKGTFKQFLVSFDDRHAAYAPQGIVFGGGSRDWRHPYQQDHYYVADIVASTNDQNCYKKDEGDIREYNQWGGWIGVLDHSRFKPGFYPRGVVFGPDGMLYVAARGCPTSADPKVALLAYLLRFDPDTHRLDAVIATNDTVRDQKLNLGFHRPEGLAFDDKGYLWVTSFRNVKDSDDVDRILKFDVRSGKVIDSLPLSKPGASRASAQAIVFGPEGKLYIPISGNAPDTTGELRRCDTKTRDCETIVKAGGGLVSPWFPIFRNSDPATLSYKGR
ncbi:hypothetical protein [Burkholderia sp. Ac-20365]|uniref:hypothetical protein n=1 Tax=Burkholderia sp. Ac-20365 TaxID=2703897 RepID=UPI00197B8672|nr:hypothetical protein [Burkholderia sp. Ac-20365]MBN3765247.1 hypothetical protein [Burkholderia sp. Ac-20365]